jgi:glutamate-1-semialdehyde 2,1-aminomutase
VDEAFAVAGPHGLAVSRLGNVGPPVPLDRTTRVAEFNDLADVESQLAHGDVAAILTEPALTNIGIVLPEPGFLAGLRDLATAYGALLIIDETHTFSAGAGGATKLWGLEPDILVIGKSIGGGIPSGAYGITNDLAGKVNAAPDADLIDVGGIGGTLAGNALSVSAMRATLEHVLTDEAFADMVDLAAVFTSGVREAIERAELPWSVTQLGARAEYRFASPAPTTGTSANAAADEELDEYLHLYLLNRGVLITPFHNMALMCPDTTRADVDLHTRLFAGAVDELASPGVLFGGMGAASRHRGGHASDGSAR